jgi:CubicO group peptidase (beta-lactamase class C family)
MASHASQSAPDTVAITRFVDRQMRLSRIPDIALVLVRGEQVVYARTFGDAGASVTPDSPFLIGSVTKTFTALAIAQLADDAKLRFDDPVYERLPGFTLKGSDGGRTISLRHLLTHTSGLSQWSGHDRRAQREARFDHIAPVRPPGVEFEYSSLNYIILGKVVEAVAGMPYGAYMQRRVFEPLEMTNSFADLDSARRHGLVRGHWYLFGLAIPGRELQQPGPLVPAGFLISSAQDLGNFLTMLLNQGRFKGRQVVSSEVLREMFTPWDGGSSGAGMAWGVGTALIGHAGNSTTFSARLAMIPAAGYGIALLTNVNSGPFFPSTAAIMDGLTRILHGNPVDTVWPREIFLKLGILALLIVGGVRMIVTLRRWSRRGFPHRLQASRRVVMTLVTEAVGTAFVLLVLPRWIGVPLRTIIEYFPDLGIAIIVGLFTGVSGALVRAFVLSDEISD